jgi:hypothetical protein
MNGGYCWVHTRHSILNTSSVGMGVKSQSKEPPSEWTFLKIAFLYVWKITRETYTITKHVSLYVKWFH